MIINKNMKKLRKISRVRNLTAHARKSSGPRMREREGRLDWRH